MAIINLDEIVDGGRPYLKKDTYSARIIEAEFTISKAGAPMIVMQWELVAPESVEVDGNNVRIAGLQFASFDTDDPDVDQYAGLAADVTLETEQQAQTTDDGSPVTDSDGNPVMNNNYRLKRVLRLNSEHTISTP